MADPIATPVAQTPNQIADTNQAAANATGVKTSANTSPQGGNFVPTPAPITPAPSAASTTTVGNGNKISQVPGIQTNTANLSNKGVTTDANGVMHYANGEVYDASHVQDIQSKISDINAKITAAPNAGYGDNEQIQYDAQGNIVPKGTNIGTVTNPVPTTYTDYNGNQVPIPADGSIPAGSTPDGKGGYTGPDGKSYVAPANDSSYQYSTIMTGLAQAKAQTDATTAAMISSIQAQYTQLIAQQKVINDSQMAGLTTSSIMSGANKSGGYVGSLNSQLQWGVNQLNDLEAKENAAIAAAQQAGQDQDFKIMEQQNTILEKVREEKQSAAQVLADKVAASVAQATKDSAISNIIAPSDGTTGEFDPAKILQTLQKNGVKGITLDDIGGVLKTVADANNTQIDKLSGNVKDFQILKGMPGGLPSSILSLPPEQQLPAYLKMINPPDQKGRYSIHDNPDGSVTVLDTATGKTMGGGGGSGGGRGVPTTLPEVSMTGTGNPSASDQKAFLATLPKDQQVLVQGIANYSINPASFPTRLTKGSPAGLTQQQIIALAAQYDPTYDSKQYATRAAMQKNVTEGNYSQAINSANTLIQHLQTLKDASGKLPEMGFTPLNAGVNATKSMFGSASVNNFNIARDAVATEAAKIYKGTGTSSDSEITAWKSGLSPNMSKSQIDGAIKNITDLMAGKLSTLSEQYNSVMGKPGDFKILTPKSVATLKALGFDPSNVDPSYNPNTDATGSGKVSDIGTKVQTARSAGYTATDIVNQIAKDPAMSDKIGKARNAGYTDDEIANQLSQQ